MDFQIICNISTLNKYFCGILNSWIALPTKLNVQQIKVISKYKTNLWIALPMKCTELNFQKIKVISQYKARRAAMRRNQVFNDSKSIDVTGIRNERWQ